MMTWTRLVVKLVKFTETEIVDVRPQRKFVKINVSDTVAGCSYIADGVGVHSKDVSVMKGKRVIAIPFSTSPTTPTTLTAFDRSFEWLD
jgi:hypothetical protein